MAFLKVAANPGMHLGLYADTACVTFNHVIPLLPIPLLLFVELIFRLSTLTFRCTSLFKM
jgi:hypothetical protein